MIGTTNSKGNNSTGQNLSISINGTNKLTYNGSAAKSLDISVVSLGAAASNHNHDSVYAKHGHSHNYHDFNNSSLMDATYGAYWGVLQNTSIDSTTDWFNRIKILHNNAEGYYTELAQSFTGEERLQHRRMKSGVLSDWRTVLDSVNYGNYALPRTGGRMETTSLITNLNADLLDGYHAWQIQTLGASGIPHDGISYYLTCQHNVNGDNRFFFRESSNMYEVSVHHSLYSNNSNLLAGCAWNQFVTSPFFGNSNAGWMAESNPDHAIIGDSSGGEGAATPTGGWCHFISMPHRSMNHHTAQIIIPFFNVPELYVRTAPGGIAGNLGDICRFYSSRNSNPCTITPNGPSGEYLWCW